MMLGQASRGSGCSGCGPRPSSAPAALEAGFDAVVEAASDVATDDEHDPEGHTIAWERQQIAGLLDAARSTLDSD